MTAGDSIYSYIVASQDLDEMTDAEPMGDTAAAKELGPNNPEQAKAFNEVTDTGTDRICRLHSEF